MEEVIETALPEKKKRIFYFDVLRVIACLAVIMSHSSGAYVANDFNGLNFWLGNIFDSMSRIGVPIFVMISGALFLDEEYNCTPKKLLSHICKMIVFFLFWSIIYSIAYQIILPLFQKKPIDIKNFFVLIFQGHYHLWFCYLIIGLYLITPLLRLWVKKENKKYIEYFLLLSLLFSFIIPQFLQITHYYTESFLFIEKIMKAFNLKYVAGYTAYFILGWYLHNFDISRKKLIYALGLLGLMLTIFGTYFLSNTLNLPIQLYDNTYFNVLAQAIAIFVLIKSIYENKKEKENSKMNRIISFISKNSLGIYALHAAFVSFIYNAIQLLDIKYAIIGIFLMFIPSFIFSLFGTWILSKIPYLKKIV